MKHSIEEQFTKGESHWKSVENSGPFCSEAKMLESTDTKILVEALIAEFKLTDNELIPLFREKLTEWLNNADEKDLELMENEKLRDFIYEMF